MLLPWKAFLSLAFAHMYVLVFVYMLECMRTGECAHMCRAEVDIRCHPEPLPALLSEMGSLSEHSDLPGVGSHFAPRILCLSHLSTKVTGSLSSLPSLDMCTGDLTSGLPPAGQALYSLSPLQAPLLLCFGIPWGSEKTLCDCHGLGLTCHCDQGTRSYSLRLVTHSRSREPQSIHSTGSH